MSLRDVQSVLLSMFYEDTILLGHSLESDLRSLKVSPFELLIYLIHHQLTGLSYMEITVIDRRFSFKSKGGRI